MPKADLGVKAEFVPLQDRRYSRVPVPILNEMWEELLIGQGACWGRVISDSMRPVIRPNNQVMVERVLSHQLRFGDIIVFKRNGQLVTHRLVGKRELSGQCYFLEKGDAVLQASLVPAESIIGRVTEIENTGKTFHMLSGSGRTMQLILACVSYTTLRLWVVLEYCLTCGGRFTYNQRWQATYNRFCSLLRRIIMQVSR